MKIGILGCGNVGSASAYACALRGVGTELVLVDQDMAFAAAQAEDILHATPFAKSMPVRAGDYDELSGAGIVMVAAGVGQKPGETRLDLLKRNADVFRTVLPRLLKAAPETIILVATNPVDIMTHMAVRIAVEEGHPQERVIGSGTILDTARFRTLIARHLGVSSHSVHAHVLGEHGDSEVLHWSGANVSNVGIYEIARQTDRPITPQVKAATDDAVRRAAYRIIQGKGATWYGIGAGMARIARAIAEDEHAVLTCCAPVNGMGGFDNVTFSLPRLIAAKGVVRTFYPSLDEGEEKSLRASASVIQHAIEGLGGHI